MMAIDSIARGFVEGSGSKSTLMARVRTMEVKQRQ